MNSPDQTESARRRRYCLCSIADARRGEARSICPLHGNTEVADAYRAGMQDAANGFPVTEARPTRSEDR